MPVDVDTTGIDVAYSCTQKGLSAPPGLSPMTISPRAAERLKARKTTNRCWYFDLTLISDYLFVSHRYHHTASATLFYALHEGLASSKRKGWNTAGSAIIRRINGSSRVSASMGLDNARGRGISHLEPQHAARARRRERRQGARQSAADDGIEIAGGFGPLAGKVFRIGLMGPLATRDHVRDFLAKFGAALRNAGYKG